MVHALSFFVKRYPVQLKLQVYRLSCLFTDDGGYPRSRKCRDCLWVVANLPRDRSRSRSLLCFEQEQLLFFLNVMVVEKAELWYKTDAEKCLTSEEFETQ
jgi:hypothetical protein